jgi:outer membrane protein X
MKKLIVALCVAVMSIGSIAAQKGQQAAGLNLGYGLDAEELYIGAKYQYGITDAIRAEANLNYWLTDYTMFEVGVNAHYLFNVAEKIKVYPLVGVAYYKIEDVDGEFGFNAGVGAEYSLTEKISINLEGKYQFFDGGDQPLVSVGVAYKF